MIWGSVSLAVLYAIISSAGQTFENFDVWLANSHITKLRNFTSKMTSNFIFLVLATISSAQSSHLHTVLDVHIYYSLSPGNESDCCLTDLQLISGLKLNNYRQLSELRWVAVVPLLPASEPQTRLGFITSRFQRKHC